jgi:hypothetical protein
MADSWVVLVDPPHGAADSTAAVTWLRVSEVLPSATTKKFRQSTCNLSFNAYHMRLHINCY